MINLKVWKLNKELLNESLRFKTNKKFFLFIKVLVILCLESLATTFLPDDKSFTTGLLFGLLLEQNFITWAINNQEQQINISLT